jgi:transposase-like protein
MPGRLARPVLRGRDGGNAILLPGMYLRIGGQTWYLWRAVDADGMVLDVVLQPRRNQAAAEALLGRLVEGSRPCHG